MPMAVQLKSQPAVSLRQINGFLLRWCSTTASYGSTKRLASRYRSIYVGTHSQSFHIGKQNNLSRYYDGDIDDVQVHGRALSSLEVSAIYDEGRLSGVGRTCADPDRPEGTLLYNSSHAVMQLRGDNAAFESRRICW